MNTVESCFKEFGTMDAQGRDITPASNIITYWMKKKKQEDGREIETESRRTDETILTPAQAAKYSIEKTFGDWQPDRLIEKMEKLSRKLIKMHL